VSNFTTSIAIYYKNQKEYPLHVSAQDEIGNLPCNDNTNYLAIFVPSILSILGTIGINRFRKRLSRLHKYKSQKLYENEDMFDDDFEMNTAF
jgi:hypothetical protein